MSSGKIKRDPGGMTHSEVVDLASLVDYAEGAIVSRALIQSEKGTLTLFAFDTGQGLSEHSTPFDALIQVLDGTGNIIIDGKSYATGTGQWILMPKDIPHAVEAPDRFKMLLTMIRG